MFVNFNDLENSNKYVQACILSERDERRAYKIQKIIKKSQSHDLQSDIQGTVQKRIKTGIFKTNRMLFIKAFTR